MSADVTIVVATHDRPVMLDAELRSIRAASDEARIVVVDDASTTPGTEAVCHARGAEYVRRDENGGVHAALVTGRAMVDSPFYSFWGDDDAMLPNWFSLNLAAMDEADVVSDSYWLANGALEPTSEWHLPAATMAQFLAGSVTVNDGALVRTASAVPLRPERERAMMMTFWMDMLAAGRRFATVSEPTWLYRRHTGQLSQHWDERQMAFRRDAIAEHAA